MAENPGRLHIDNVLLRGWSHCQYSNSIGSRFAKGGHLQAMLPLRVRQEEYLL